MEKLIQEVLVSKSMEVFGFQITPNMVQFQKTRKDVEGDLTLVTFPMTKLFKSSPEQVGEKIGEWLKSEITFIEQYEVIKGFLNLSLSFAYWSNQLQEITQEENFGWVNEPSNKTFMVEFSSPNTNKPLHLGHLRNIFLGNSVSEILKANGHHVIKTQIINDRGIHICKSMIAWERFAPIDNSGKRETPQSSGLKGDHFVGKYYIEYDKQLTKEALEIAESWRKEGFSQCDDESKETLTKLFEVMESSADDKKKASLQRKIAGFTKNETTLQRDAQEMLVRWEAKDPQVYLLWSTMNGWVYKGFERTYNRMKVSFDKLYFESDTYLIGKDIVLDGLKKGVFYQKDDGSVWVDLTSDGLDEKLLLRGDGTAVYMTQDIGTAIDRYKDFPDLSGVVYTVGNEQDYHFKVLFLILKKLGYSWAENCFHLSYGMVDLPDGKMKSREGKVVDADDLMEEVVQMATASTKERGQIEGMSEEEKRNLIEMIGIGGLKYYLLKVDPQKRMKFNPDESIELTGNTAPFIQYAHARIQSLLNKAANESPSFTFVIGKEEKELIKQLTTYPKIIQEAGEEKSPALIANYTYELVKSFNSYYQSVSVLNEPNSDLKNTRLTLCGSVGKVIASSMSLLGIEVPNRM